MSKIILFFPKYESSGAMLLPMSVLSVAAPLVGNGYDVKIIDQRADNNWKETILNEFKNSPSIFGVSALTGKQISYGLEVSKFVKENSNVPIVWGGVHASLLPYQTLKNPFIDFIVVGEGEETFLELAESLKQKKSIASIKGLGHKKDNKIIINNLREFVDINSLPEIPYNLININNYISETSFATGKPAKNIAFYTSRGCPHRCGFCYNKEFNKGKWRGKSAEKVFNEIKYLVDNYQINSFDIEDDEFFVDTERARKICQLIIQNNLNIEIFTSCRVNYVANNMDDTYLALLYRAGFRTLSFGVESGSERIIELMHKDIKFEQVFLTIEKLKRAGINSKYYFMAGFPTETIEDLYQTTDLILKMKKLDPQIRIPSWRFFTPYPGTDLYNLAIKEGWHPPQTLEEWANYDFRTITMPWMKGRKKRIIKNVSFLINYLEMEKTFGRGIRFKLAKNFGKIIDWRWKNHFFSFLPEKYFIYLVINIKKLITSI